MTKTLIAGCNVRLAAWHVMTFAKFDTARHYLIGDETPQSAFDTAVQRGHSTAWAVSGGSCISSDPSYYERQQRLGEAAVVLEDGEVIAVEGEPELYTVKVVRGNEKSIRNSDPIHFIRIK